MTGFRARLRPRTPRRVGGVVEDLAEHLAGRPGRYELLRPPERIERPPPSTVGPPHPVFERLRTHVHPPVFRAWLPGAQLAGQEPLVLTCDRRPVLQSTFDREQLDANPVVHQRLHWAKRRCGTHLLLHNQWGGTHFHWFLDTLPRAALLPLAQEPQAPVIVPPNLSRAGREALRLVGVSGDRALPFDGTRWRFGELVMPSLVGATGNPPRWALEWLRDRLAPAPGPRRRRLLVSRADAASRRIGNEAEVQAALADRGFERIVASDLPFAEQLAVFAEADAVVAPHGAGLVNLLACRGTRVLELFGASYVNGCYYALASALDLPYHYLVVQDGADGDLEIDLPVLARALDAAGL